MKDNIKSKDERLKRRVVGYLKKPRVIESVVSYTTRTEDSESKLINMALEFYFKTNPEPNIKVT